MGWFSHGLDVASGYWVTMTEEDILDGNCTTDEDCTGSAHHLEDRDYSLGNIANLLSFPSYGSIDIPSGIDDGIEDDIRAVIGEGYVAVNTDNGWIGGLLNFEGLRGYWIILQPDALDDGEDVIFNYDLDNLDDGSCVYAPTDHDCGLGRTINPYKAAAIPSGLKAIQSTQQAFYFIDNVELLEGEVESGDWFVSYCGNSITGSRQYLGEIIDIPVMGYDGNAVTAGYCEQNDTPHCKLYKSGSGEMVDLYTDTPNWESNGIFFLNHVKEATTTPVEFAMLSAYPNPFNPITSISYEVPMESMVEISIFDLRGQKVSTLVNKSTQPGNYSINWDANNVASGVYFVHFMVSGENITPVSQIQKLMLLK